VFHSPQHLTLAVATISSTFRDLLDAFIKFLWGNEQAFRDDFER
jgi:hypothetical protein